MSVAGLIHREVAVRAFVAAVQANDLYGVRLEPEPSNLHDPNAIKVHGWARDSAWHIGYLDRDTAEELTKDLVSKSVPLAAELYRVFVGDNGMIDVKIICLAPPGYSLKKRLEMGGD